MTAKLGGHSSRSPAKGHPSSKSAGRLKVPPEGASKPRAHGRAAEGSTLREPEPNAHKRGLPATECVTSRAIRRKGDRKQVTGFDRSDTRRSQTQGAVRT